MLPRMRPAKRGTTAWATELYVVDQQAPSGLQQDDEDDRRFRRALISVLQV